MLSIISKNRPKGDFSICLPFQLYASFKKSLKTLHLATIKNYPKTTSEIYLLAPLKAKQEQISLPRLFIFKQKSARI
jgi:hypothetical protein